MTFASIMADQNDDIEGENVERAWSSKIMWMRGEICAVSPETVRELIEKCRMYCITRLIWRSVSRPNGEGVVSFSIAGLFSHQKHEEAPVTRGCPPKYIQQYNGSARVCAWAGKVLCRQHADVTAVQCYQPGAQIPAPVDADSRGAGGQDSP